MYKTPETLEKLIGERIRKVRLQRNISQAEVASRTGLSTPAISRLESGAGSSLSTFVKVLQVLGEDRWLETLAPESTFSPIQQRELGRQRLRARTRKQKE